MCLHVQIASILFQYLVGVFKLETHVIYFRDIYLNNLLNEYTLFYFLYSLWDFFYLDVRSLPGWFSKFSHLYSLVFCLLLYLLKLPNLQLYLLNFPLNF